jgi:hypothetical protein
MAERGERLAVAATENPKYRQDILKLRKLVNYPLNHTGNLLWLPV